MLNLVQLRDDGGKVYGTLETAIDKQTSEKERVIDASHILKHTCEGVYFTLVYVSRLVKLKVLLE